MSFDPTIMFPILAGAFILLFFAYYISVLRPRRGTLEWIALEEPAPLTFRFHRHPVDRRDALPILLITLLYGVTALTNLGDTEGIESFHHFTEEDPSVTVVLAEETELREILYYTGLHTGDYLVEVSTDGIHYRTEHGKEGALMGQDYANLFKWRTASLEMPTPVRYLRITAQSTPMDLGEICLITSAGARLRPAFLSYDGADALFDETERIPEAETCRNSAYFDEIYHVRTAYEHYNNIKPYEISHPPLGKLLICLSIAIFGMVPFGWRFMGALFGMLMLPVLYCLIKNLFGKRSVSICGTLLLAFDFMHFTQTRIATIDTYGVFFILLMFWFFYRYLTVEPDAPFRKSVLPLFLSGLAFGLGAASKWTAIYGGAGLGVIWLIDMVFRLRDACRSDTVRAFFRRFFATVAVCIPFFVLIPAVIYVLAYIPYGLSEGLELPGMLLNGRYYKLIWDNQVFMYSYHSKLVAEHPYSSTWSQWILDIRPILYYRSFSPEGTVKSAISSLGNPVVWWGGLLAMFSMLWLVITRKDGKAFFILLGYFAQLLPWVFISRIVFIYHYFPSTLFLVLALSHVFTTVWERGSRKAVIGFTLGAGVLFLLFYPSISGLPCPLWYTDGFLRWLPKSWPL